MRCVPRWTLVLAILLGNVLVAPTADAQRTIPVDSVRLGDTTLVHRVRMLDGTTFIGRIVAVSAASFTITTSSGTFTVDRLRIDTVTEVGAERVRRGVIWDANTHQTRLLFSPTAFPLDRGEGYYANFWLFLSTVAVGVTDRFTVGAGLTTFPTSDITANMFFFLPKFTVVQRERFAAAVGALAMSVPGWDAERVSLGIVYGVTTFGEPDGHLTLGAGWGYVEDRIADRPVLTVGGLKRTSRSIALITENWIFPSDEGFRALTTYGFRFLGERLSADLAFGNFIGGGATILVPGIPLVGFAFRF